MASTPSSSKATQRATANWTTAECAKMDKYLIKEAAGSVVPDAKWENGLRRHSLSSIKAKRRHRVKELIKAGVIDELEWKHRSTLPSSSSSSSSSSSKRISGSQAQRELFNTVFSGAVQGEERSVHQEGFQG